MPNSVDIYQNIAPRFYTGTWKTNAALKEHQHGRLEGVTESKRDGGEHSPAARTEGSAASLRPAGSGPKRFICRASVPILQVCLCRPGNRSLAERKDVTDEDEGGRVGGMRARRRPC